MADGAEGQVDQLFGPLMHCLVAFPAKRNQAFGTFTVSPTVVTFEPGTGILMLTGVGLLGLMMRKCPATNG